MFEEENMKMELQLKDIVHKQKIKADLDKLKIKKIKKYAPEMENRPYYALASVVILIDDLAFRFIYV
jgi:hypothetical protein